MFDIGWMELLLIGIVALIVVGPKDLPKMFRTVGTFMGKARGMAREFQRSMEQAADDSGLREAARDLNSVNKLNLNSATGSARKYAEGLVKDGAKGKKPGATSAGGPTKAAVKSPGAEPEAAPDLRAPAEPAPGPEAAAAPDDAGPQGEAESRRP